MIALGNRRIFLCGAPVDMRKGIDGLAAIVLGQLQRDPNSGDIFVFGANLAHVAPDPRPIEHVLRLPFADSHRRPH